MPTPAALLEPLTKQRLRDLVDQLELSAPKQAARATLAAQLAGERGERLPAVLAELRVAELRLLCTAHGLEAPRSGGRQVLAELLLAAVGPAPSSPEPESAKLEAAKPATIAEQVDLTPSQAPTLDSVLDALTKSELVDLAARYEGRIPKRPASADPKARWVAALATADALTLPELLDELSLASLKRVCRAHDLSDKARAREVLRDRILGDGAPVAQTRPLPREPALASPQPAPPARRIELMREIGEPMVALPVQGDMVRVRQRQYLVVEPPQSDGDTHAVRLVCLDDDAQGEELEVLWELELGARRIDPGADGLGTLTHLEPARRFAAYYHALAWQCASAAEGGLLQAPFHAGIELTQYQLVPLIKALELPRANLFIADDVGAGKTIEAGLVVQELRLRGRLDWALIVCPASICLQWQREMQRRFGLRFEIFDRRFVARRRKERGFGVNPWATHDHFIISYHLIRRPEYRESLFVELGARKTKSLLVLDEAHTAAPAAENRYAVDSQITQLVRGLAPRFENRLFLSATPHNGHTNSFSALLELLDPARFNRGVPVEGVAELEPIMVRRLKSDLRALGVPSIPIRQLVELRLEHHEGSWQVQQIQGQKVHGATAPLGVGSDVELRLSTLLAEYTKVCRPLFANSRGRGQVLFVGLQKRLLSSLAAFAKTLSVHADTLASKSRAFEQAQQQANNQRGLDLDTDTFGEEADAGLEEDVVSGSRGLAALDRPARARELLDEMLELADRYRDQPDAKALALLDWIRKHQCPAVQFGGASAKLPEDQRAWSDRRLIIFTEYADTKDWLVRFLKDAISGTDRASERIAKFEGGMDEETRDRVQSAFTGAPEQFPVRILVATDAAREGVNLQTHCQDLIHYDIPWNPARMEQRNGRIDRKLQPAPVVRCMYFTHPQRAEDRVLAVLVEKIDRIQRQLGSLSAVIMERLHKVLDDRGIDEASLDALDDAEREETQTERTRATHDELEAQRDIERMRAELDRAAEALDRSSREFVLDPRLLKETVEVACMLVGGESCRLVRAAEQPEPGPDRQPRAERWLLPTLPVSWARTLDHLRMPKLPDETFVQWRARPLLPVVFGPDPDAGRTCVQLHLEHPLVQRLFARFRTQGWATHDLSRATVVRTTEGQQVRAIAVGRLSLFGHGATRLHDRLVHVVAQWSDDPSHPQHLEPFGAAGQQAALRRLRDALRESAVDAELVPEVVQTKLQARAAEEFARLWPHLRTVADDEALQAGQALRERGRVESEDLAGILERQRKRILREIGNKAQLAFAFEQEDVPDIVRRQVADERRAMETRLGEIDREVETEPAALRASYEVVGQRLEPVGLIYLWPSTR